MKSRLIRAVLLSNLVFLITGCANLSNINKSRLNHPAMDFEARMTPKRSSYLTTLDSIDSNSGGGACTVCAK